MLCWRDSHPRCHGRHLEGSQVRCEYREQHESFQRTHCFLRRCLAYVSRATMLLLMVDMIVYSALCDTMVLLGAAPSRSCSSSRRLYVDHWPEADICRASRMYEIETDVLIPDLLLPHVRPSAQSRVLWPASDTVVLTMHRSCMHTGETSSTPRCEYYYY